MSGDRHARRSTSPYTYTSPIDNLSRTSPILAHRRPFDPTHVVLDDLAHSSSFNSMHETPEIHLRSQAVSQPMSSGVASSIWAVVSQLEAHAAVLLAECEEIRADYERCREYTQHYGDHWEVAIRRLKKLRAAKQSMVVLAPATGPLILHRLR